MAYSSLGGFRGSIYTDAVQGIVRLVGTVVALAAVGLAAHAQPAQFMANLRAAGDDFLTPFPSGTSATAVLAFFVGFAMAAVGFGLGQPQIISRYMAGRSPQETRSAAWIYIGFLQFTWISMTCFGMALRGVMPGIADPEQGLSIFLRGSVTPLLAGILIADVYATIASTSNGVLVAIGQLLHRDVMPLLRRQARPAQVTPWRTILLAGVLTVLLAEVLPGSVFSLALGSVSKIGAALAAAVIVKLFGWRHSAGSLLIAVTLGFACALGWSALGYSNGFNEAGVGMIAGLVANHLAARAWR